MPNPPNLNISENKTTVLLFHCQRNVACIIIRSIWLGISFKKFIFIYFWFQRDRGGERGQCEKHWLAASHMCPDWELNPQPRHVPQLAIQPGPFGVWDDTSTNWAIPTGHDWECLCDTPYISLWLWWYWMCSVPSKTSLKLQIQAGCSIFQFHFYICLISRYAPVPLHVLPSHC